MFATQPVGWRQYLSWSKMVVPTTLHHYFYVSWEDALWDLLERFAIPNGTIALVPEFFCQDVIQNMAAHGLRCVTYPMDDNFQTDPIVFRNYLKKYQPQVVVIFHAVGITNALFENHAQWTAELPKKTLLIEDSVHRTVEPAKLTFIEKRHFVIDSLRKVTPLAGSNLYTSAILPETKNNRAPHAYTVTVFCWWLLFQICLKLNLFRLAECAMLKAYDLTGDSYQPGKGWWLFKKLALNVDVEKIKKTKTAQVKLYQKKLKTLVHHPSVFFFTIPETDFGELRGFPIGLSLEYADAFLQKLRGAGLLVRFELNDSRWSQRQKVIYLPLGPHLKQRDVEVICELVR